MALPRPRNPARFAIVTVLVILVVNLAIFAGLNQRNGPAESKRPVDIVALSPDEGQLVLPQNRIGAQLRTLYSGQLTIGGRLIPADQISGDPNLGEFYFDPGPGKEYRELPEGPLNAVVEWWPREYRTPEEARAKGLVASYSWSFKVG
ncbi:MAG: hypothetical protein ACKOBG_03715 [Actinomycetota bacterium]